MKNFLKELDDTLSIEIINETKIGKYNKWIGLSIIVLTVVLILVN